MTEIGLLQPFLQRNEWTIHCDQCPYASTILVKDVSEESLVDVAECTYLQYWKRELQFLDELAGLVEMHSDSPHPYRQVLLGKRRRHRRQLAYSGAEQSFEDDLAKCLLKYKMQHPLDYSLKWQIDRAKRAFNEQLDIISRRSQKCPSCDAGNIHVSLVEFLG